MARTAAAESDPEKKQASLQKIIQKNNTSDLLCGLKALNAIICHVKKDMVNRSVSDNAAVDMAKSEEQLLCD